MPQSEVTTGHRQRLRERFLSDAATLSDAECLELLLSYAIPRQDVAPQAASLLRRFGSLPAVLVASPAELTQVSGIGEYSAALIALARHVAHPDSSPPAIQLDPSRQPSLFEAQVPSPPAEPPMSTFSDDEAANSLVFLPQAAACNSLEAFHSLLRERLPYNSAETRRRRANYFVERFFPEGKLKVPLADFAVRCAADDLKPVVFYHLARAEPLLSRVAEEYVWPALPLGRVEREGLREFVLRCLPSVGPASQTKILRALFNAYGILSVATENGTTLRFQAHPGTLAAFWYILTAEFPQPGMYSFEAMGEGPLRHWLLWDRAWMRRQLYYLAELGLVSKVSEIDSVRQFSLALARREALERYVVLGQPPAAALRESAPEPQAAGGAS
jgi:DNA repair protein RadC